MKKALALFGGLVFVLIVFFVIYYFNGEQEKSQDIVNDVTTSETEAFINNSSNTAANDSNVSVDKYLEVKDNSYGGKDIVFQLPD